MNRMLRHRLTLALFTSMIGCGGTTFRCDPGPSWSSNPPVMLDAAMPTCTASTCAVETVSAGARHACAVVGSGREVVCWGANEVGQSDWRAPRDVAAPVSINQRVDYQLNRHDTPLAAGELRSCVVVGSGIVCWGGPTPSPEIIPAPVVDGVEVGLDDVCWGSACLSGALDSSQGSRILLSGATRARWREGVWRVQGRVPVAGLLRERPTFEMEIPGPFEETTLRFDSRRRVALAAGALHSCIRDEPSVVGGIVVAGGIRCIGRGDRGQLGADYLATAEPEGTGVPTATEIPLNYQVRTIRVGGHLGARWTPEGVVTSGPLGGHTCFATLYSGPDSGVFCMGANDRGQLGVGSTDDTNTFVRVVGLPEGPVEDVRCGGEFTCARTGGGLFCWGDNRYGQLGVDPSVMAFSAMPVRIDLASAFTR